MQGKREAESEHATERDERMSECVLSVREDVFDQERKKFIALKAALLEQEQEQEKLAMRMRRKKRRRERHVNFVATCQNL